VKGGGPSSSNPANGSPPILSQRICAEIKSEYRYLYKLPRERFEAATPRLLGEAYLYGSLQVYVLWVQLAHCAAHCTVHLDRRQTSLCLRSLPETCATLASAHSRSECSDHSVGQPLRRSTSRGNPGTRDAVGPLACKSTKGSPQRRTPIAENSCTSQRIRLNLRMPERQMR
jgi:hypothetical protein